MNPTIFPARLRFALAALSVIAAVGLHLLIPQLPRYLIFLPAVLASAFVGGRRVGIAALLFTALVGILDPTRFGTLRSANFDPVALVCYLATGALAIAITDILHRTLARLSRERRRLEAALAAANAAVWELSPQGVLDWDENFYRLVGLKAGSVPPATSSFLEMVHPDDREKMATARRQMDEGIEPRPFDEYRLTRPDGTVLWLQNHRAAVSEEGGSAFIGITQDITRRKNAEERVSTLLKEADHRARNLFMVIMAIARETRRTVESIAEFDRAFGARLLALARSNDLLIRGEWKGTTLRELVASHLEPFGAAERCQFQGPELTVVPNAAQYLGMALHELATNAAKYGALAGKEGAIRIAWRLDGDDSAATFALAWEEDRASPALSPRAGFGSKVLLQLVPQALNGEASRELQDGRFAWRLSAPLSSIAPAKAARA